LFQCCKIIFLFCLVAFVACDDDGRQVAAESNDDYKPPSLSEADERAASAERNAELLKQKVESIILTAKDQADVDSDADRDIATYKAAVDALALIPSTSPAELFNRLAAHIRSIESQIASTKTMWEAAVEAAKQSAAHRLEELKNELTKRKELLDRLENAGDGVERVKAAAESIAANFEAAKKDWEAAKDWIASKVLEVQSDILNKYHKVVELVKSDLTSIPPRVPSSDPDVIAAYKDLRDTVIAAKIAARRVNAALAIAQEVAQQAVAEAKKFAEALKEVEAERETVKEKILEKIHEKFSDSDVIADIKRRAEVMCNTVIKECVQQTTEDSVGIDCHNVVPEDDNLDLLKKCFKAVLSTVGIHDEDTSVDASEAEGSRKRQSSGYTLSATAAPDAEGTTTTGNNGGLSKGGIAGIILGCIAGVAILVIVVAVVLKKDSSDYV